MSEPGRWAEGEEEVETMISMGELERVLPSPTHAERLFVEAERHLSSAEHVADADPPLAYDSLYSAARKSLSAVLAIEGLRATSRGGHLAVQRAIEAQLGRMRQIIRAFHHLRITRNEADYPSEDTPPLSPEDVREDLPEAVQIVAAMRKFAHQVGPF